MSENIYQALAAVIFVVGAAISTYFRLRAERMSGHERISLESEGLPILISLRIAGSALWLGVFAYLLNPAWMAWSQIDLPYWLRLTGVFWGAVADALVYRVFSSLGNNVTPTVVTRSQHQLVTTGPYRWVRHPLYAVGFISYVAFAILSANWYIGLLSVVTLVIISLRVPKEEEALVERNGDAYREYAKRTGRFLPRLG